MRCVDLAPVLERGIPVFPSHPHFVLDPTITHERDGYYCQSISMAEHTGCHCDAPSHEVPGMMHMSVEVLPPNQLVAPARVYDFSDRTWEPGQLLTRRDIEEYDMRHGEPARPGDIALINFGWLKKHWATDHRAHFYSTNQPGMDEDVAILFRDRKVAAVGADTIACEIPMKNGKLGDAPGHLRHWLPNAILILECVANLELLPRSCFLFAAPLPIKDGSGSPLRPLAFF
jgi:kynurenine formamidase